MPRNMSFSMTTEAVRAQRKYVTRRLGWKFLEPGDVLWAVEKAQGLKKGEHVKRICKIRVVHVCRELVGDIGNPLVYTDGGWSEVKREGFSAMSGTAFVEMFCKANKCSPSAEVARIEFEYVEEGR